MNKPLPLQKLFLMILLIAANANAQQVIFKNDITGILPSQANPFTSGQITDPNVSATGIGHGTGLIAANTGNDAYAIREWNTPALDLTGYFEFTITPLPGYEMNFTNLSFATGFSGAPSNTPFLVRSSRSDYGTNIAFSRASVFAPVTVDLSGGNYQRVASSVTFRIYPFGSANVADTFTIYDFTFSGTVTSRLETTTFEKTAVVLYPNPVANLLTISSKFENMQYRIFNIEGREIAAGQQNQSEVKLDCSRWESGIYLIKVSNEAASETFKIVKN